jgi:hypothetical protein
MRRLVVLVAAAVVAVTGFAPAPARASTGSFTQHTWPSAGAPGALAHPKSGGCPQP